MIEAADTGPWFHTNTAVSLFADLSDGVQAAEVTVGPQATGGAPGQTIEDAIMFYNTDEFNNSPGGQFIISIGLGPIALDTNQIVGTGAVLRALNGAFNVAQSCHRIDAALALSPPGFTFGNFKSTANKLCSLANDEFIDALDVLNSPFLGPIFPGRHRSDQRGDGQLQGVHQHHQQFATQQARQIGPGPL